MNKNIEEEIKRILKKNGASSIEDIRREIGVSQKTVSKWVDRLVKSEEIVRYGKRSDKGWKDILCLNTVEENNQALSVATHMPILDWEEKILRAAKGFNVLAKDCRVLTVGEVMERLLLNPDDRFQRVMIQCVMTHAGWKPAYLPDEGLVFFPPKIPPRKLI